MALDVYKSDDQSKILCSLNSDNMHELSHSLTQLEKKTGVSIDEYSDTYLYPSHQSILLSNFNQLDLTSLSNGLKKFIAVLLMAIVDNETLLFKGD